MQLLDGKWMTNATENMSVFAPHFQQVYNNHCPADLEFAKHIPLQRILWKLNDSITYGTNSPKQWINQKMSKAQVSLEFHRKLSKPCPLQTFAMYTNTVMIFSLGIANHEQWHCSQCVTVPKCRDLSDPNKWRRVMLMEVCSKIFSSVMNGRALQLLNANGTCFQFGGTPELGCQDGLFVLNTLLTMHKNHNLPTYVAFVDLVKAYIRNPVLGYPIIITPCNHLWLQSKNLSGCKLNCLPLSFHCLAITLYKVTT